MGKTFISYSELFKVFLIDFNQNMQISHFSSTKFKYSKSVFDNLEIQVIKHMEDMRTPNFSERLSIL